MINILIVEDNLDNFKQCKSTIMHIISESEFKVDANIYHGMDYEEAWNHLNRYVMDIIFLDIYLSGKDGYELAEGIRSLREYKLTPIVFISAERHKILETFKKYHSFDYITKPYTYETFSKTFTPLLDAFITEKNIFKQRKTTGLTIKHGKQTIKIDVNDIFFAERNGRYVNIHTKNRVYDMIKMSLRQLIDKVPQKSLMRCHKSYVVNTRKVEKYITNSCRDITLHFKDYDLTCQLSPLYLDEFTKIYLEGN